ncbi:MAG: T9SS type A sorting domain-containing protein, partial [Bacteroidota bacterium]|nr:T9SS type A sorting domain-containing protein [Bacteroidota bacterium]
ATYGPGSYLVCASAAGGNDGQTCTECETIMISDGAEVELTADGTDVTCADATNGTITATASEGTVITVDGAPYAAGTLYAPGSYLVCASVPGTVCESCETVIIGAPDALMLDIAVECVNGLGTATANATGGTGEYTYLWSTSETTASISGLTNGEHWVTVTDENGCWVKEGFSVDCEIICEVELTVTHLDVSCFDATNGTITASATEGAVITVDGAPYMSETLYAPGSYSVCASVPGTVCEDCETVVIGAPDALMLDIAVECVSGLGTATANATGGTGEYTYLWSTSETTASISGLTNGEHWVVVTDENGCWMKEGFTVDCEIICAVEVVVEWGCLSPGNGWAVVDQINGATTPTNILWSTGETVQFITGLENGDHWVMVTDANGCWDKVGFTVDCGVVCEVEVVVEWGCLGASNGWAVVDQIIGATAPTQILWSTGETVQYITGLSSGDHWVMVTDANGCWDKVSFSVDCEKECQFRTQTQGGYGAPPNGNNPGTYVHANFASAFPGGLTIGCTNTLTLTSAQAVTNYLPGGGQSAMLPSGSLVNPINYNNTLAAQLVAATLSVGFDEDNEDFGDAETLLGDAYITSGLFMGWTVNEVLVEANNYIGGCGSTYTKSQLNTVLTAINENYVGGTIDNGFLSSAFVARPVVAAAPSTSNSRLSRLANSGRRILMDETAGVNIFEASPNPASDMLNVRLVHGIGGQIQIDLMDLSGRSVQQVAAYTAEAGEERRHVLSVDSLPAGVYLLSVQQNGSRDVQRIVVGH